MGLALVGNQNEFVPATGLLEYSIARNNGRFLGFSVSQEPMPLKELCFANRVILGIWMKTYGL